MDRLPPKARSELDDAGQALWDELTASRGDQIVGEGGGLLGPFNAWVQAPTVGSKLAGLGVALRYDTSLDRNLIELAILTVGSHYRAEFEWMAHSRMARRHGVEEDVIAALAAGREPVFDDDRQRAVHLVASELVETGHLSAATHATARAQLTDVQLVELVTLVGYYALVSFTLNAFDVGLPPGSDPQWPRPS
jgi:4-carboxymuconolactone decarboxylase